MKKQKESTYGQTSVEKNVSVVVSYYLNLI